MKRILLFLTLFLFVPQAYAKSIATIKLNSNVSTSSEDASSVKNDITVENNGKVTHYSSDKSENIEINSNDDVSEIKVNGKTVSGTPAENDNSQINATPSSSKDQENSNKTNDNNENKSNNKNLFNVIEEIFKRLFSFWK